MSIHLSLTEPKHDRGKPIAATRFTPKVLYFTQVYGLPHDFVLHNFLTIDTSIM